MQSDSELIASIKAEYDAGNVPARSKCCGKCAFRAGSPERSDGYAWANLVDGWSKGAVFFCHEGVQGHHQQEDGVPLQVCAGFHATRGVPEEVIVDLAHMRERPVTRHQVAYFEEQANDREFCNGCQHLNWTYEEGDEATCDKAHSIDFKMPESPVDVNVGYYNTKFRTCPDCRAVSD